MPAQESSADDHRGVSSRLPRGWVPPIATRQYGLFTRAQALAAGATPGQVRHRRESGRWQVVAGRALTAEGDAGEPWRRAQAAALTWPDAVVCLATAALIHHLPVPDDGATHVIVPTNRHPGARLVPHRVPLGSDDVVRVGLALITSRERTLVDCVGRLPRADAERLVTWAGTRELLDPAVLASALRDRPGAWGNGQRRQAAADLDVGAYNAAERRLHSILRKAGVSGWRGDQRLDLGSGVIARVDVLFPEARLVIEVDGLASHGRAEFQADRTRQNALVAAGYTVLRFTWWDLVERPDHVARAVRMTLARLTCAR